MKPYIFCLLVAQGLAPKLHANEFQYRRISIRGELDKSELFWQRDNDIYRYSAELVQNLLNPQDIKVVSFFLQEKDFDLVTSELVQQRVEVESFAPSEAPEGYYVKTDQKTWKKFRLHVSISGSMDHRYRELVVTDLEYGLPATAQNLYDRPMTFGGMLGVPDTTPNLSLLWQTPDKGVVLHELRVAQAKITPTSTCAALLKISRSAVKSRKE